MCWAHLLDLPMISKQFFNECFLPTHLLPPTFGQTTFGGNNFIQSHVTALCSCGSRISHWGVLTHWGCQPPTQVLFGGNVCKNGRIGSCWGGGMHKQHPPDLALLCCRESLHVPGTSQAPSFSRQSHYWQFIYPNVWKSLIFSSFVTVQVPDVPYSLPL